MEIGNKHFNAHRWVAYGQITTTYIADRGFCWIDTGTGGCKNISSYPATKFDDVFTLFKKI